ncbi:MAG: DEDD exonuclease domain-containing protein [Actinomycetota bacterium]|nr:DEDD exonuclease domain-containing protein [Actinomycetota bacterium]
MQRSLDDLGTPLSRVTFCVLDLETTGGSPQTCGITEIGAVRYCGGERLGTFATFVDPGMAVPPAITMLTGITDAMVAPAPRVDSVLPSLLEFVGDAVIVGHNVRFDVSFLNAALASAGRGRLTNRIVDTAALARRLLTGEVRDHRLSSLAQALRLPNTPRHRALDDALATADLLHVLIERASAFGVMGLEDLIELPKLAGSPHAHKLRLTDPLPRRRGVYLFRGLGDEVLYVGKATNLRARVRSYFSTDERRKVASLLRETQRIEHHERATELEAAVTEIRLIHLHEPRYNRQGNRWRRYVYVKLTTAERFPRLAVARSARGPGLYLGPIGSSRSARLAIEAIETVVPLRRCTERVPATPNRAAPCTPFQLGVASCPCAATISADDYGRLVQRVVQGLTTRPDLLLDPLADRMDELARAERFEEAADVRDRAAALAAAIERQRRFDRLRSAGRLVVELADATRLAEIDGGRLWSVRAGEDHIDYAADVVALGDARLAMSGLGVDTPVAKEDADELHCVDRWLRQEAHRTRIVEVDGTLSSSLPALPSFRPRTDGHPQRRAGLT